MPYDEIRIVGSLETSDGKVISKTEITRAPRDEKTIADISDLWRVLCENGAIRGTHAAMRIEYHGRALVLIAPSDARDLLRLARAMRELTD